MERWFIVYIYATIGNLDRYLASRSKSKQAHLHRFHRADL